MTSKAWPFEEARRVLKRYEKKDPEKGYVLFETGYGPSGLPHIGTFGEVGRTTMIRRAFEIISDIPTKLLCFSDDMDGMRKIPGNVPDPAALQPYMQRPLTAVPDPFGTHGSFGAHMNARLNNFLDTFGFEYEFASATEYYRSGRMDAILLKAAEKYDEIMEIMLKSLREERRATYSCFLPISPTTGRVLYVPMKQVTTDGMITFDDEDGTEVTMSVTGGNCKLQWKPDFGARWAALGVDFEMYGKDHATNTPIYDGICRVLGGRPPEHFTYELFLDAEGHKISKTSGNGLTIDEWLTYAATESLSYFMYLKPKTAKRMHFDVIPKAVDEYHQQLRAFHDANDPDKRLANPVFHIHGGEVPASDMVVPFSMLLNLASVAGAEDKDVLWGFIRRYAPEASPETYPQMDRAAEGAVRYYNDFVAPAKVYRMPTEPEREALEELASRLRAWDGPVEDEALQGAVYDVGRDRFEPMRDWFKALYQVLLGADQGPRFGGFIALYGVAETADLIERALAGELAGNSSGD